LGKAGGGICTLYKDVRFIFFMSELARISEKLAVIEKKIDLVLKELGFDELDEEALKRLEEVDKAVKENKLEELIEI